MTSHTDFIDHLTAIRAEGAEWAARAAGLDSEGRYRLWLLARDRGDIIRAETEAAAWAGTLRVTMRDYPPGHPEGPQWLAGLSLVPRPLEDWAGDKARSEFMHATGLQK